MSVSGESSGGSGGQFRGRRILGLFPHPDDEAYSSAGTLAICALGGADVAVASLTRGEKGAGYSGLATGLALAERRTAELEASCRAVGAAKPLFLDFPDGGLRRMDEGSAVERIHGLLEDMRPEVLITLGPDGVYGHRDHLACTGFAARAVRRMREERRPRLLYAVFPRDLFQPVRLGLSRAKGFKEILEPGLQSLGMDVERADLIMDISAAADRKLAAISCHRTQLRQGDPTTFLWPGLTERLLHKEWFMCAAGPPLPGGAADPFAGI